MAMCTRYNLHVIKFVNDLWQVSHTNETDRHDIAEILLKVALNTISLTPSPKLTHSLLMCCVLWRCNSLSSGNAQEVRYRSVSITQMVYRRYIYLSVCWDNYIVLVKKKPHFRKKETENCENEELFWITYFSNIFLTHLFEFKYNVYPFLTIINSLILLASVYPRGSQCNISQRNVVTLIGCIDIDDVLLIINLRFNDHRYRNEIDF